MRGRRGWGGGRGGSGSASPSLFLGEERNRRKKAIQDRARHRGIEIIKGGEKSQSRRETAAMNLGSRLQPFTPPWRRLQRSSRCLLVMMTLFSVRLLSPDRWSKAGATRHLLKKASVSGSTTSRRASFPPALMAATTSECVFPSTDRLFTCGEKHGSGCFTSIDRNPSNLKKNI